MYHNAQTQVLDISRTGIIPNLEALQERSLTPVGALTKSAFRHIADILKELIQENKALKEQLENQRLAAKAVPFMIESRPVNQRLAATIAPFVNKSTAVNPDVLRIQGTARFGVD